MEDAAVSASAMQEQFMRAALEMARRGMAAGGPPVGASITRNAEILAKGHNAVIGELDITAHAEMVVIRAACRKLRQLQLSGCVLYVTVQPCPMCLTAAYYAGIQTVVYGSSIESLNAITGNELCTAPADLFVGRSAQPALTGGVLQQESDALLASWAEGRV